MFFWRFNPKCLQIWAHPATVATTTGDDRVTAAAAKLIVIVVLFSKAWPVTERWHVLGSSVLLFGNLFPFISVRKNDATVFILDGYGLVPAAPQRQIQHRRGGWLDGSLGLPQKVSAGGSVLADFTFTIAIVAGDFHDRKGRSCSAAVEWSTDHLDLTEACIVWQMLWFLNDSECFVLVQNETDVNIFLGCRK